MRLALVTGLLALAVRGRAAPQAVYPPRAIALDPPSERPLEHLSTPAAQRPACPPLRKREDEPHTSTASAISPSSSSLGSTIPLSSSRSTLSFQPTPSLIINDLEVEARSSSSGPSADQLRIIGVVGGFLAGIALVAIICSVLLLIRNQRRARSSAASSSTRSRSRTHSRAQQPPALMTNSTFPIIRVPPPPIYTAPRAPTTVSGDATNATAGHTTDLHHFPTSPGQGSASSRTTSFGHSDSGTSGPPRRAPQIPSLGLSQARPFLRSVASAFSYHASVGHSSPIAHEPEPDAEADPDTSVTHGAATSMSETRTAVTTEDTVRTAPIESPSEYHTKSSGH